MIFSQDFRHAVLGQATIVRSLNDRDASAFRDFFNAHDQDFSRSFTNYPYQDRPLTTSQARETLTMFHNAFKGIGARIYYVFRQGNPNTILGAIITSPNGHHSASVAYYLSPSYRRKGYMADAQQAVVKQLSTMNKGVTFMEQVALGNKASMRLLLKAGYSHMGNRMPTKKNRSIGDRPVATFVKF